MKKYRHPVTTESNLLYAISQLTGLTYREMEDEEIIWFLLQGLRPVVREGPRDGKAMFWLCQIGVRPEVCEWTSGTGHGGSSPIRQACRQHLRDKHQKVRARPQEIRTSI